MADTETTWLSFIVGILVSVIASIMNAAGLNLLNLDHIKNSEQPAERQRNECGRPLWHVGLYLYVLSQLFGSTIALYFLKAQWVAPLGSVALIFNFVFARVLVGTRITKKDIIGTLVVIVSVVWIVVFGGQGSDDS
ncbi:3102_t:CDS:2, partial [Paraglomus occultum]